MRNTIAVMNTKGGVGKSTLVLAMAETLSAKFGKNVLVIDTDSQASVSLMLLSPGNLNRLQMDDRTIVDLLVASVLNNLGMLYHAQGLLSKAEPLYREALAIDTKVLPKSHPDIATDYNSLGVLHFAQEKRAKAEEMHLRALAIRKQSLPPAHPDIAISLYNLGRVYEAEGRLAKAEPLFRQAVTIFEQSLPPDNAVLGRATAKHAEVLARQESSTTTNRNGMHRKQRSGAMRRAH